MLSLTSADFFQNQLFQKILSGNPSECQTVLDPDQSVGPDLAQNSLQRSLAEDKSHHWQGKS